MLVLGRRALIISEESIKFNTEFAHDLSQDNAFPYRAITEDNLIVCFHNKLPLDEQKFSQPYAEQQNALTFPTGMRLALPVPDGSAAFRYRPRLPVQASEATAPEAEPAVEAEPKIKRMKTIRKYVKWSGQKVSNMVMDVLESKLREPDLCRTWYLVNLKKGTVMEGPQLMKDLQGVNVQMNKHVLVYVDARKQPCVRPMLTSEALELRGWPGKCVNCAFVKDVKIPAARALVRGIRALTS